MEIQILATTEYQKQATAVLVALEAQSLEGKLIPWNKELSLAAQIYDFATAAVAQKDVRGIIIDDYGIAGFQVANKVPGMICALVSDEHSARMTRDHNNTQIVTLGGKVLGDELLIEIVKAFVSATYAGGRHQIRVDMLTKLTEVAQ
ncbi:MAG: RpiB/LacA/LacB family sugar-phosphate isomerase [Culicoidibacterales bacterium]